MNTTEQTSDPTLWRYPSLWSANRTTHLRNLEQEVTALKKDSDVYRTQCNKALMKCANLQSQLEEARWLLGESNDLLNEVAAFGNCDCDIPKGVTCVPCQCALHINKTKAWLSAHTPTGKEK